MDSIISECLQRHLISLFLTVNNTILFLFLLNNFFYTIKYSLIKEGGYLWNKKHPCKLWKIFFIFSEILNRCLNVLALFQTKNTKVITCNVSHKLFRPSSGKVIWNSRMVDFPHINESTPLLHAAASWKRSNTEACVKKLSQILANNIDNGSSEIGLIIFVR